MSQPAPHETATDASPVSRNREEEIARMTKHAEEFQKRHPGTDLKLDQKWWVPGIDFNFRLKETLDQETLAKVNACIGKMMMAKFAADAVTEAREELKTILAAYPDLLQSAESQLFPKGDVWAKVNEYLESEAAAGRDHTPSCAVAPQ
ncbi:hypothetical protein MMYC01_200870 [Madurella mycetomatis]|uniref:Uncharacterized protein n=1 Tax=Madurella mycetomatis TaxID=100816 RepID=A0A175WFY0_9PEZI|nr:hypothetical protein MMYC01_205111 [Madurella mycetomatis]KXX82737.1 hypothetical protein MMYC01_200870 [Madurella mycetomatis]